MLNLEVQKETKVVPWMGYKTTVQTGIWAMSLLEAEHETEATQGPSTDVCWRQATPGSGEGTEVSPECFYVKEFC